MLEIGLMLLPTFLLGDDLFTRLVDQSRKKRSKTNVMLARIAEFFKGISVVISGMGPDIEFWHSVKFGVGVPSIVVKEAT